MLALPWPFFDPRSLHLQTIVTWPDTLRCLDMRTQPAGSDRHWQLNSSAILQFCLFMMMMQSPKLCSFDDTFMKNESAESGHIEVSRWKVTLMWEYCSKRTVSPFVKPSNSRSAPVDTQQGECLDLIVTFLYLIALMKNTQLTILIRSEATTSQHGDRHQTHATSQTRDHFFRWDHR